MASSFVKETDGDVVFVVCEGGLGPVRNIMSTVLGVLADERKRWFLVVAAGPNAFCHWLLKVRALMRRICESLRRLVVTI